MDYSCWQLWAVIWMLDSELGCSMRTTSASTCEPSLLTLILLLKTYVNICVSDICVFISFVFRRLWKSEEYASSSGYVVIFAVDAPNMGATRELWFLGKEASTLYSLSICDSLYVLGPGSGIIWRCGLVGIGMTWLQWVCHCGCGYKILTLVAWKSVFH